MEPERVGQELLFRRLMPVPTGYHRDLCCMDGTRQSLLNQIMDWVANKSGRECSPEEYVLVIRLTRDRKNVVSPFDLCNPSQAEPLWWSVFLSEGRPEFERAYKHPPHVNPHTRHTLPRFSNHCSETPS